MKIDSLRSETHNSRFRISATVTWEDCDRPTHDVYFEIDEALTPSLFCNPHAFLVACIIPAMHYGEERVRIDAQICPELHSGLITAMSCLRHWYYQPDRELVRIEARTWSKQTSRTPERAGIFFSGGIDSFAALRANRLHFPSQHPGAIKDGLLVYGFELDEPEAFEHVLHSLSEIAGQVGLTFIPVYTNLYLHYRPEDATSQFRFWMYEFQGAALAAVAHALARRLTSASIAATFDLPGLGLWGSHPLLDPNYSSADMRIRHEDIASSRFAKTKLIADWKIVLPHLRVCNQYRRYRAGMLNCGRCEKCVRTMLALLALGVLDQTHAFPLHDVSAELIIQAVNIHNDYVASCYHQLISPLKVQGRHDLTRAIEHQIACYHREKRNWRAWIKRFDTTYFNGNLARFKTLMPSRYEQAVTAKARES